LALRLKLFGNAKRKSFLAVSTPLANKEEPEDPCQAGGRRTLVSKSGSTGLVGWLAGWQDGWCESQHLSQHNALTNTLLAIPSRLYVWPQSCRRREKKQEFAAVWERKKMEERTEKYAGNLEKVCKLFKRALHGLSMFETCDLAFGMRLAGC